MSSATPLLSGTDAQEAEFKNSDYDAEQAAGRSCWGDFVDRTRNSTLAKVNLVQYGVSMCFLILTLIGGCHLGRAPVCFIEPWLADFLPLAVFQIAANVTYLFWPETPERHASSQMPLAFQACACVGWVVNFFIASILMCEGIMYGSSYHFIHIPRFVLSAAEIVCAVIITSMTWRRYQLARTAAPHLPA